jgi:type VI secretion system protein ImpM
MTGDPMNGAAATVGFFGKLPSRGDFVRAGLSRRFTDGWDAWLQDVLPACRDLLGADWGELWWTAPAWRFALSAGGPLGGRPVLGLLLPSADRAERLFPLTIAAEGSDDGTAFLDEAEQIGRRAIDRRQAPDMLLARLLEIAPLLPTRYRQKAATPSAASCRWWAGPGVLAGQDAMVLDGLPAAAALAGMLGR